MRTLSYRPRATAERVLAGCIALFAVGMLTRTAGVPDLFYDVAVYNTVYLAGAVLCWRTRATDWREIRAWRCAAVALA